MTSRPTPSHVSASDALPTRETVALAKGFAARACASKAADCAWPNLTEATRWIELIPLVALGALVLVCPEVPPERLARCLMSDPGRIVSDLRHHVVAGTPRADLIEVVAQQILGGDL